MALHRTGRHLARILPGAALVFGALFVPAASACIIPPPRLDAQCRASHKTPQPDVLPRARWKSTLENMRAIAAQKNIPVTDADFDAWLAYFEGNSPEALPVLPPLEGGKHPAPIRFEKHAAGDPAPTDRNGSRPPIIGNVRALDLDHDGAMDILVSDVGRKQLRWIRQGDGPPDSWPETPLADLDEPVGIDPLDFDRDGDTDLLVAVLGRLLKPDDERVGSVVLLRNDGNQSFTPAPLFTRAPRVADVRAVDVDRDGDTDVAFAAYGWRYSGAIAWMEQADKGRMTLHQLAGRSGGSHLAPGDYDNDGDTDFAVLFSQEHEAVVGYDNDGKGGFTEKTLYRAPHPAWGFSSMSAVDLDQDGDLDLLCAHGDGLDASGPKPYHGVHWLENRGRWVFVPRRIATAYGVYAAEAADLDGDGDLDVVFGSQFNRWDDPRRHSLAWLENTGDETFIPHGIARTPTHIGTLDLADFDGDGRTDIVTGCLHIMPPFDRLGRVTVWYNRPATPDPTHP